MWWRVFFIVAWLLALFLVPIKEWRRIYPAGIVALIMLYIIDSFLINLGLFSYRTDNTLLYELSGVPTLYWTSGFPAGILLVYFYPKEHWLRLPYILFTAGLFLGLEWIMGWLGYFHPIQWSSTVAYLLDIGGFIVLIWLSKWFLDLRKV